MISKDINLAATILREGGIIGLPTETVYGLAGNIFSEKAISAIFQVKQRPLYNPLIVHIKNTEELKKIAIDIPQIAFELANKFWPGPLTLLLKKNPLVPDLVSSLKPTVAVRMPNHPTALALLNELDFPLAAPSANPFGMISPTKATHVDEYFANILVLDGGTCETGIESTIVGFMDNEVIIYRLGGISIEDIKSVSGEVTILNKQNDSPDAPGMLSKHYSPKTPLFLTDDIEKMSKKYKNKRIGLILFSNTIEIFPNNWIQRVLSPNADLKEAASKLYDTLHILDKMNLDCILAEKFPDVGMGSVINDKLSRASQNNYTSTY